MVSWAKSPRSRRTQRPPCRSMAGMTSMALVGGLLRDYSSSPARLLPLPLQANCQGRERHMATRTTYLVPVDGTAGSEGALLCAVAAARRCGGQVIALGLTWVPPNMPMDDVDCPLEARTRRALQLARALAWE